jgi:hypothetical protein
MSTATPLAPAVRTLRAELDERRAAGTRFTVKDAVGLLVPLTSQLGELHAAGHRLFVHPSSIDFGAAGSELVLDLAKALPSEPRDRAAIAPECKRGQAGDDRATVFALGAIFYELVTGEVVGPGMKRPREANPSLPSTVEVVLGKALVGDPKHRPHDIAALAQAFHHLAPAGSMPPPPADESHLDHEDGFDVDVSLSMIPPAPSAPTPPVAPVSSRSGPSSQGRPIAYAQGPISSPYLVAEAPRSGPNPDDPTVKLADLKARLESDPRPRYVVMKDGMDHGPFSAVELLQQIASRDSSSAMTPCATPSRARSAHLRTGTSSRPSPSRRS